MRVNGKLDIGTNHKSNVLSALGTCASETYKEFSWKKGQHVSVWAKYPDAYWFRS